MSDKRGDRYCGMATRRKQRLTEVENKFLIMCGDVESAADIILKIAEETGNSALREQGNKILYESMFYQGWLES